MFHKFTSFKEFQSSLKRRVDGDADTFFEYFIIFVIIINSICLGLETSSSISESLRNILVIIDQICLFIFVIELVLKAIAFGKDFFTANEPNGAGWWNTFDLIIVLISIFATVPYFSVFRGFKIFRAARLIKTFKTLRIVKSLKIINSLEQLQRILRAIVRAIPSIIWTFVLLLLVFYFYAIVGVNLFGLHFEETFGSLGKSFYTLFQLMLFDDWGNITRPILSEFHFAFIYFISFGIISAYTILQVVTGIVVDSIQNVTREKIDKVDKNETQQINDVISTASTNATTIIENQQVTLETLSAQIAELQKKIEEMQSTLTSNGRMNNL